MKKSAPQDPKAAAEEIERGQNQLGFKGVIINSHTQGEYLDDPKFWPIFEAAQALDTPIYLHPSTPPRNMIGPMLEAGLDSAIYGFAVETGLHLLRIITAGVFDHFPRLRLVVGHLGEALPFGGSLDFEQLWPLRLEEVAEIVGIPENTVKTRMFYARKRLAELLKAAGIERGWP